MSATPTPDAFDNGIAQWGAPLRAHETMTSMIWSRFRRHPGAIAGIIVLSIIILAAILAPLSPYDPLKSDLPSRLQPPSLEHPFGTDALGRDLLTRCLYGGRVSLSVGFLVVLITLVVGIPLGAVAGFFGGRIDNVLMRITDAALALPALMVLILLSAITREVDVPFFRQNNVLTIALVIGVLSWMPVARLVRASFLTIKETEFITAAHCIGTANSRIMARHILPNAIGPIIVESTLEMAYAIMEEAGLSFLGFGIMPPTPSWGNLLNSAWEHMTRHPWLAFFPGLMIFLTIISINYIGDGLRDAFDPYKMVKQAGE
jgi:peptide/nickel transport system permease protein